MCSKEHTHGSGQAAWGEGWPPATAATSMSFEYSMLTVMAKVCGPAMVAIPHPHPAPSLAPGHSGPPVRDLETTLELSKHLHQF